MKTMNIFSQKEKGQVLVFVAILFLLLLIPLTALFIDGGVIMLNRRQAQAAADAGALAGAKSLCEKNTQAAVINTAVSYATVYNKATTASVSVTGNNVSVTATVSRASIFAKLIGINTLTSTAPATAACVIPSKHVLPFTWYCTDKSNTCGVDMFDWNSGGQPTSTLYLLSFDWPANRTCSTTTSATTMICNIPANPPYVAVKVLGDSKNLDVIIRSMCNNPGNVGKCIQSGESLLSLSNNPYAGQPGNAQNIWKNPTKYYTYGQVYLLPFYDGGQYNIAGVTGFMVKCVNNANNGGACVGAQAWYQANAGTFKINADDTIEGYFIKNYPWDLSNPGSITAPNLGAYYVSLTK